MAAQLHVLVDLANTQVARGQRVNRRLVEDRLEQLIRDNLIVLGSVLSREFIEVRFRLYDGWFDEAGSPTDLYSMARAYVSSAYPMRQRNARIFASLADGPVSDRSGTRLLHTLRVEAGLPRFTWDSFEPTPLECALPRACTAKGLERWLRGHCPERPSGCPVATAQVVTHRRQKLVDTLLVADAVWLASEGNHVAVVSNDEDMIPALVTARQFESRVFWLCRGGLARPTYRAVLNSHEVECLEC